jgi:nitrogen regulatory protein PII
MFNSNHHISLITAALPVPSANAVIKKLTDDKLTDVLVSKARGTVLRDHWWKSWVPPISPSKSLLHMVVPAHDVDRVVNTVIVEGRLDMQSTGAVFSTPCESSYIGTEFENLHMKEVLNTTTDSDKLSENLSAIFCCVSHKLSDTIAKAAINAGGHGPVVYFAEGKGLRDRLGWLRITKDSEQEILMVLADNSDVEAIFTAMAKAGEFHLPGRGFMYRIPIDKGMFNLPSRVANPHYTANTQQIIHAIDHLAGHTHWRDQSAFDVGGQGKGAGLNIGKQNDQQQTNHVCFSTVVNRDQSQKTMDLMLDAGAPGLNISYSQYVSMHEDEHEKTDLVHTHINNEYATIRCITNQKTADLVTDALESQAEIKGIKDICVLAHVVPRIAKYIPGTKDHRKKPKLAIAS